MAAAKKTANAKVVDTKSAEAVVAEALGVKVEAPKAEEIKSEAETTPVKEAAIKAAKTVAKAVEKAAEKKNTNKKSAATKAAKDKKEEKVQTLETVIHLQFADKSYSNEDLLEITRNVWQYDLKKKVSDIKSVELYVKPEESIAYYVINGTDEGSFAI